MIRTGIVLALIFAFFGCNTVPVNNADREVTPDEASDTVEATWRFEFFDTNEKPLGHMLLVFTEDRIDEPTCGNDSWKKMLVLEDNLDFDFGVESRAAYSLHGPWLTIDLTSSVCYLDHILVGNFNPAEATGFFNVSHQIGGENIGRFSARPISGTEPR